MFMKECEDLAGCIGARRMEVTRTYDYVTVSEKPSGAALPAATVQDSDLAILARYPQGRFGYAGMMPIHFDQCAVFNKLRQVIGRSEILVTRIHRHDRSVAGACSDQDTRQRRRLFTPGTEIGQVYLRLSEVRAYSRGKRMLADRREESRDAAQVGVGNGGVGRGSAGRYGLPQGGDLVVRSGDLIYRLDDIESAQSDKERLGLVTH